MGPNRAGSDPGARLFAAPAGASIAVQMQAPIANAAVQTARAPIDVGSGLPLMSSELRHDVAAAGSRRALLDRIKAYIDQDIVAPRFTRFNESWRSEIAPPVAKAGEALQNQIRIVTERFPDEASSWTSLDQAVAGVMAAAPRFKIEAPMEPLWWSEAETKGATFQGFLRTLGAPMLQRAAALADLEQRTEAAIAAKKKQQAEIEAQIARLNEEFKEQRKQLAALVEPLKAVFIDRATLSPTSPPSLPSA